MGFRDAACDSRGNVDEGVSVETLRALRPRVDEVEPASFDARNRRPAVHTLLGGEPAVIGLDILFDNLGVVLFVALVLWLILRSRRASRTPEARARAAETAAARADAIASSPDGWSLTDPDRERYGFGVEALPAYGIVASGPDGRRFAALALSKAAAYQTAVNAVNGDHPETDAWAPPIPPAATHAKTPAEPGDAVLPSGWVLQAIDRESYNTAGEPVPTYGALAVCPGGERALVVTRDKNDAIPRLVDHLEGRLDVTESWVFRID